MKKFMIFGSMMVLSSYTSVNAQGDIQQPVQQTPVATPVETAPPATTTPPPTTTTTTTSTTATAPATTYVYPPETKPKINVNRLRFGAFLAPNISWMKPTAATDDGNQFKTESNGSKLGFTYGLMADYFFAENYGIVTGLSINSTGGKILATAIDQTASANKVLKSEFDYRLQYLDVPLALKLRTDNINGFRFFGQLGISAGFNISKKADYNVRYYDNNTAAARDTSGTKIKLTGSVTNIAPIMFQMNIGAGAEYPINNKLSAYVGLFFNNGFAPDATNPEKFDGDKLGYKGSFKDANTRLNNFALRVGLFF